MDRRQLTAKLIDTLSGYHNMLDVEAVRAEALDIALQHASNCSDAGLEKWIRFTEERAGKLIEQSLPVVGGGA